jgi:hypothetical protein
LIQKVSWLQALLILTQTLFSQNLTLGRYSGAANDACSRQADTQHFRGSRVTEEAGLSNFLKHLKGRGPRGVWQIILDSIRKRCGVLPPWILEPSATGLCKPDLHVFAKLFEDCLKRGLEAQAFSGREIGGDDDVLDFLVGHFVDVGLTRLPAS